MSDFAGVIEGRFVSLRPLMSRDLPWLYDLSIAGSRSLAWRFHGATPSPALFEHLVWQDVLAQFVVEDQNGLPCGHTILYKPNFVGRYVYFAILMDERTQRSGQSVEASLLTLGRSFNAWPFQKVYMESPRYAIDMASSMMDSEWVEVEAVLADADFMNGEYHDVIIASICRTAWESTLPIMGRWSL